ncbi:dTDP-4-dehydrorhamnose reductase [Micromonospora sp. NPDC051227]|uniref:dTDP-4-dehydrorhamnose reductase n=1 Tax=Micromonospora sp. NPDC051227 TaxID=3364285 RepID=UPI0037AFB33F
MRIYLTGADGMLGTALRVTLAARADTTMVRGVSRHDFDIADARATHDSIRSFEPDIVVHTAAHAIVDECEANPGLALRTNTQGTRNVVSACAAVGSSLLYISSDYVFDGENRPAEGYREDSLPNPRNVYGLTKLAGEQLAGTVPDHLCVRTSWLFGGADARIDAVLAMTKAMLAGRIPRLIHDQFSSPTYVLDLAEALVRTILSPTRPTGVIHVANSGSASWHEVGLVVAGHLRRAGRRAGDPAAVSMNDGGFAAARPRDSTLATERFRALEAALPHWSDAVRRFCDVLLDRKSRAVAPPAGAER